MIYFLNDEIDLNLKENMEKIFLEALKQTSQKCEKLTCSLEFVSKDIIHSINLASRNVDSETDVLSFPLLDIKAGEEINPKKYPYDIDNNGELSLGDIIICEEVANAQAEEYGHSQMREKCYLFLHGLLHLLGYDHIFEKDKQIMREKEESILSAVNSALIRKD